MARFSGEMQAPFSGGAEFQKHSHIVGLGLYDWFEIAHGDEVSSELTGDVCGVV